MRQRTSSARGHSPYTQKILRQILWHLTLCTPGQKQRFKAFYCTPANATCATVWCGTGQRCVSGGASGARCVSCGACGGGVRRPLCGSDARTYASWCRLQRAACHAGTVVDPLHPGPCKGKLSLQTHTKVIYVGLVKQRSLYGSYSRPYASWYSLQLAPCYAGTVVHPLHPGPCKGKLPLILSYNTGRISTYVVKSRPLGGFAAPESLQR